MVDEKGNHEKGSDDAGSYILKKIEGFDGFGGGEGATNMVMTMKEREKSLNETTAKVLTKPRQMLLLPKCCCCCVCVCVWGG